MSYGRERCVAYAIHTDLLKNNWKSRIIYFYSSDPIGRTSLPKICLPCDCEPSDYNHGGIHTCAPIHIHRRTYTQANMHTYTPTRKKKNTHAYTHMHRKVILVRRGAHLSKIGSIIDQNRSQLDNTLSLAFVNNFHSSAQLGTPSGVLCQDQR